MKTEAEIGGMLFENGGRGPGPRKEAASPLSETEKGKETDPSLEPPEGTSPTNT